MDRSGPRLFLLALSHFLVDMHSGMLPVVLFYQHQTMGLSLAQIGVIAGVYNFGISLTQPLFGYLADRFGEQRFAAGAVIWVSLFGASLGFARSFPVLLVLAALQSIGPAAFHPTGAAGAGRLASNRKGSSMSVFLSGGSLGTTVGPVVAATVLEVSGMAGTAWIGMAAAALALTLAFLLVFAWPKSMAVREVAHPRTSPSPARRPRTLIFWLAAAALLTVTGVRTWVHMSLNTYLPQYLAVLGYPALQASRWLSVMLAASTIGVMLGGPLADRLGPRAVISTALAGLGAALYLLSHQALLPVSVLIILTGFSVGLPLPLTLVIGQSLLSQGAGLASGLVLGTSFVFGAIGVTVTGFIADAFGLPRALLVLSLIALGALVAGLLIPNRTPGAVPEGAQSIPA